MRLDEVLAAWQGCLDPAPLDQARGGVALCVDLSRDGRHATVAAAQIMPDGRARVELLADLAGPTAASNLERVLPALLLAVKPRVLGWFPNGPAAAVAAKLAKAPAGVTVTEIRGDTPAVVMGFAKEVAAVTLAHSGDPLLDAHVLGAEKLDSGGGWVFSRRGGEHADAAYAAAGAVHLARTVPRAPKYSKRVHVPAG